MLTTTVHIWHCYKTKAQILQKIMLNTQLFQYFGLWAKNSNKMNNDAERGVRSFQTWHVSRFILLSSNRNNTT